MPCPYYGAGHSGGSNRELVFAVPILIDEVGSDVGTHVHRLDRACRSLEVDERVLVLAIRASCP